MSSTRPVTNKSPSASTYPMSPVKYQPPRKARASESGRQACLLDRQRQAKHRAIGLIGGGR